MKDKVLVLLGPEENLVIVTGEEKAVPEVKAVMENGSELDATATMEWELLVRMRLSRQQLPVR